MLFVPHFCKNGRYQYAKKEGGSLALACRDYVLNVHERRRLTDDVVIVQLGASQLYKFAAGPGVCAGVSVQIKMLHIVRVAAECYF